MENIKQKKFYSKRIGNALIVLRNLAPLSSYHFLHEGTHVIGVHNGLPKKERTSIIRGYLASPPVREFDLAGFRKLQEVMLNA